MFGFDLAGPSRRGVSKQQAAIRFGLAYSIVGDRLLAEQHARLVGYILAWGSPGERVRAGRGDFWGKAAP